MMYVAMWPTPGIKANRQSGT